MPAPTYVTNYSTGFTATGDGTSKSVAITGAVGDVFVVAIQIENNNPASMSLSGASLTWTLQQSIAVTSYCKSYLYTSNVLTGAVSAQNITATRGAGGGTLRWGVTAMRWSGTSGAGIGASNKANASTGLPSLSLTTTQANSAIVVANGDWNAVSGSSRAWGTSAGTYTEVAYDFTASVATFYDGYYADAGAVGSKTINMTAPSGQAYALLAVEVLGTAGPEAGRYFLACT